MAGNKANAKTKGKEDRSKVNKGVTQPNDDCDDGIDFAVLRKPIPTSVTGFAQARKIFDLATEELKDLLTNECDLMYECKVCRNIFRSLANFISHKRVYCKEKFSTTSHSHFVSSTSTENEMLKIKRAEEIYQKSLKVIPIGTKGNEAVENDDRIPLTKDITAVYEKIINARGSHSDENQQVVLKKIPSSSVAVFQNLGSEDKPSDSMKAEVQELDEILSRKRAVLQSDGKFFIENEHVPVSDGNKPDSEAVIQISDDDDDNDDGGELKCKICDLQFSTQKTLKFHMKYKHLESRLVYPCPDCLEIFSTSWSVYRHLFKVHRKTAAQIRRLRESIQSKAFKMNNPPAFYEKRKNVKPTAAPQQITEEERRDQENQAWMDNMEGDGEMPRCGGCGRTFERRAALAAHTHTCQPRSRALARVQPRPDAKRIEIQIRKDYNKTTPLLSLLKPTDATDTKSTTEETEAKTKPTEEEKEDEDRDMDEEPMDIEDDDAKSSNSESPEKREPRIEDTVKPVIRLPYNLQAEKSNLAAFKQRIASDIDSVKLQCKKCEAKYETAIQLYEHMSEHVKWMRYACKLCNFKHYSFDKLPEHVKIVHKLKGDSDFYHTTVKAIDGKEAMMMSTCMSENGEENTEQESPESRRASRCSSDSSRVSDDSSSSATIKETMGRKRKMYQGKVPAKKKKDDDEDQEDPREKAVWKKSVLMKDKTSPSVKPFEENSSDLDDIDNSMTKRTVPEDPLALPPRRPVRKRTKVKNEDFEYDLSNLLKMEAQGYRDSQTTIATPPATTKAATATPQATTKAATVTPQATTKAAQTVVANKPPQAKKKTQQDTSNQNHYESLNRDCIGAVLALSKKAVEIAAAQMKHLNFPVYTTKEHRPNVFVRPTIPRILARGDKSSPRKDVIEEIKDIEPSKICKIAETVSLKTLQKEDSAKSREMKSITFPKPKDLISARNDAVSSDANELAPAKNGEPEPKPLEQNGTDPVVMEKVISRSIPAVVPLKFRRQSLELMKNHPAINKNITDFTKAGMKTKILVIKPIHRNKDGKRPPNTPLKFQTIKLRDPSKGSSSEVTPSDQVMVVKVPKVPCTAISERETPMLESNSEVNTSKNENIELKFVESVEKAVNNVNEENYKIQESVTEPQPQSTNQIMDKECESTRSGISETEPVSEHLVLESGNDVDNLKTVEVAAT